MVGLVGFFVRTRIQRNVILSLFVAMAIGGNILNANSFRKDSSSPWESRSIIFPSSVSM